MKRNLFILLLVLVFSNNVYPQNPLVKQWDYRFGGSDNEWLYALQITSDNGFILGGMSISGASGDKTQFSWGSWDFWIIKTDPNGSKEWDKRFGGTNDDRLRSLNQTIDGGYILGGYSKSDNSGDVTQSSQGLNDYWIVKIDSIGNKLWDKRFGGADNDYLFSLQQTIDNGYILGGYSSSDSSGDKTQDSWGGEDHWIIKTDSLGNKLWDKRFGGTGSDILYSLHQTSDKGYILGGYSSSDSSGDKTQPSWGGADYWLVKVDSLGNKEWDKRFGGTLNEVLVSLQQTTDGGYILGGWSASGISGDKTEPNWDSTGNTYDYWIIKTDPIGIIEWDKRFGGTGHEDQFATISQTSDGGYLIAGDSYSQAGGDKTENNLGSEQSWILKTDSLGNKQWDKTIFTPGHDEYGYAFQTYDGCYVIANCVSGGIGGYKTQQNWGGEDYWIVKFCDTTLTAIIKDLNFNSELIIYPNPFINDISILIPTQNLKKAQFRIINILGQTIFYEQEINIMSSYTKTIDLGFLTNGIYTLEIINDEKRIFKKIVKK